MVAVPATALRKGPAGDHVFVLESDGQGGTRAHVRHVQSGPAIGDDVVIVAGLEAGEQVADQGSFKLYESALVAVSGGAAAGGAR
jgi:membrane fusion protein (multidrug efflux system)